MLWLLILGRIQNYSVFISAASVVVLFSMLTKENIVKKKNFMMSKYDLIMFNFNLVYLGIIFISKLKDDRYRLSLFSYTWLVDNDFYRSQREYILFFSLEMRESSRKTFIVWILAKNWDLRPSIFVFLAY